jgi:hypothetical protein
MADRARVPDQPRDARHPAARIGPLASIRARVRRRGGAGGLRAGHLADARGPRRVPAPRRRDRRGHQGDVRLRRQGRSSRGAAPRAHRVGVPGVRAAPAATPWKVWYTGSQFRYEKPQRGRYRQFDQVGIEVLGADDPYLDVEVIALGWEFYRGSACSRCVCCSTASVNPTTVPATWRRCRRTSSRVWTTCRPRAAPRCRRTRCACSTRSGPRTQRSLHLHRRSPTSTALRRRRTSTRCRPGSPRSASRSRSTPSSCAASTTTVAPPSSTRASPSTRRRTPSAAADATTVSSSRSAGRPRRRRVRARSRPHAARLRRRGRVRTADHRRRGVRRRHDRRARGGADHRGAARGRVLRRPRLREPQHEEPDEGRRPQRRGVRRHRRHRTNSRPAPSSCARCAPTSTRPTPRSRRVASQAIGRNDLIDHLTKAL